MKIRIRYDNQMTILDVPEEDCTVMIQTDLEARLATATDRSFVKPRSVQEIVDERFNRPDYNNWRGHWRHADDNAIPRRFDHKVGFIGNRSDDAGDHGEHTHFDLDAFPDVAGEQAHTRRENYQETCAILRRLLKPNYAEMIIAIHLDGLSLIEYAAMIGDKPNNVSHRLQRAKKKLREILKKRPF